MLAGLRLHVLVPEEVAPILNHCRG